MVLSLKRWKSRTPPGLVAGVARYWKTHSYVTAFEAARPSFLAACFAFVAGWSSPVARQAHNLKVTGSNPVPATRFLNPAGSTRRGFLLFSIYRLNETWVALPQWYACGGGPLAVIVMGCS